MSAETRTIDGRSVGWSNGFSSTPETRARDTVKGAILVGKYAFDKTEFHIGIYEFLYGTKHIPLKDEHADTDVHITIPDNTQGVVRIGDLSLPYSEYVHGVAWALCSTGGSMPEEQQHPLHGSLVRAVAALETELLSQVPSLNQRALESAQEMRTERARPVGILGLKK